MRADLAALGPDTVAALANVGFVKKATRELEAGHGPVLDEAPDGTVTGTFADGTVARLPPGQTLKDAPCSCGALGHCRHKVMVALAYRPWVSGAAADPAVAPGDPAAPWSPGEVDDEAVLGALGPRAYEEARRLRRRGLVVSIVHGDTPVAKLPTCTVRFLVPGDLAYARCDCVAGHHCAHVAIAVWAFRGQPVDRTVEVHDAAAPGPGDLLAAAADLAADLLLDGVGGASPALAQRFEVTRQALVAEGAVWPATALDDLEAQLRAYRDRSARYASGAVLRLLAEVEIRRRAVARATGELPVRYLLGQGELLETRLDTLKLVSLGARVEADGRVRTARVLLADPDTTTVLVAEKSWSFAEGEALPEAPELVGRRIAGNVPLGQLARGQVVTRVAKRWANGTLGLGQATGGAISVTPQTGDWSTLPSPIRQPGVAALLGAWARRPPRALRPRRLAEDVHVLPVAAIEAVIWDPGAQTLAALARDPEGHPFRIVRAFRAVAPRAIDALAAALTGAHGPVRFVAGEVRRHLGAIELDPSAVAADRVIVPDLADEPLRPRLPAGRAEPPADPLEAALLAAASALEEAAHLGLRAVAPGWPDRIARTALELERVGLATIGRRLGAVGEGVREARRSGSADAWTASARAWLEAAVRVEITREVT